MGENNARTIEKQKWGDGIQQAGIRSRVDVKKGDRIPHLDMGMTLLTNREGLYQRRGNKAHGCRMNVHRNRQRRVSPIGWLQRYQCTGHSYQHCGTTCSPIRHGQAKRIKCYRI